MDELSRRFDDYLPIVQSGELKSMVRLWGVRAPPRKDECIAIIRDALRDPERVRAALASLTPYERTAMAIVKWMGGAIESKALAIALRMTGVELPKPRGWGSNDSYTLIEPLVKRGLLLSEAPSPWSRFESARGGGSMFSDDRLLAHVGALDHPALTLAAAAPPPASIARRPPIVIMDILGVLQAIDSMKGLALTKAGDVRTGDMRKLMRALGWSEQTLVVDGLAFPNPAQGIISALYSAHLLELRDDALVLGGASDQIAQRPFSAQIGDLLRGFLQARDWREEATQSWYDSLGVQHVQARMALTIALMRLPPGDSFFTIDDLDRAIFERIGEHFSLRFPPTLPYPFHKSPEEIRREQQVWRERLRAEWLKHEREWLTRALASWLYYLGVVEIGLAHDAPISFRLTDLGRAVLHPHLEPPAEAAPQAAGPAWLIQPDFEVVVYLERTNPEQIAFIERYAERVQAQAHIARYRLTRESVYRGLESGSDLDDLIEGLARGASADVPQNVLATVRDWAEQRERIILRRRTSLLEFPDAPARDAALSGAFSGDPVGERFILLHATPAPARFKTRIDYNAPLPACLSVDESGVIRMQKPARDLLIRAQLDRWAEAQPGETWRLSEARVGAATKAGLTITSLFALLRERLTHPLPPLLGVALRAWAGRRPAVALATVAALRCADPAVFAAIASSTLLAPYLRGTLGPDVLLVDIDDVAALRERLRWAGLELSEDLGVRRQ